MFSNQYLNVLTHPLRISSTICSSGSFVVLFTCLTTSYWAMERSPHGLIHSGLWEICLEPTCQYLQFSEPEHLHVTRAFVIMALLCGVALLLFICISFERVYVGPIYFMVVAGLLSFTAGFFTLIGISVFTAAYRSKEQYAQHLIIFGSSYGLCWASIPMYVIAGSSQLCCPDQATSQDGRTVNWHCRFRFCQPRAAPCCSGLGLLGDRLGPHRPVAVLPRFHLSRLWDECAWLYPCHSSLPAHGGYCWCLLLLRSLGLGLPLLHWICLSGQDCSHSQLRGRSLCSDRHVHFHRSVQ